MWKWVVSLVWMGVVRGPYRKLFRAILQLFALNQDLVFEECRWGKGQVGWREIRLVGEEVPKEFLTKHFLLHTIKKEKEKNTTDYALKKNERGKGEGIQHQIAFHGGWWLNRRAFGKCFVPFVQFMFVVCFSRLNCVQCMYPTYFKNFGHFALLRQTAVVFDR